MSVLIRGMEMPKDCLKCPFCLFVDGYWKCLVDGSHADFGGTCRPSLCPLIEFPAEHGRLIDGDAIEKQIDYMAELDWNKRVGASGGMLAALEAIEDAPTIIEADPPKEET